jgi:hypothetical protein
VFAGALVSFHRNPERMLVLTAKVGIGTGIREETQLITTVPLVCNNLVVDCLGAKSMLCDSLTSSNVDAGEASNELNRLCQHEIEARDCRLRLL